MTLGIFALLYITVLLLNAVAVLNPERFLARIGLHGSPDEEGVRGKVIQLVAAVRTLMRIPLIIINVVIILYEILLG